MRYGAVATGHPLTSEAAMSVLREGGNAFDAAISAYVAACVAEPAMASLAAGAFANLYHDDRITILDAFCQTPLQKNPRSSTVPIPVDFGTAQEEYYGGYGTMAIPGVLKGLYAIHERFGSMPFSTLLEPAIGLARQGVSLNEFQRFDLKLLRSIVGWQQRGQEIFFSNGELKKVGDTYKMDNFADFLEVLGKEGEGLFYEGEIAEVLAEYSRTSGGHLTRKDLTDYSVHWRSSHEFYRNGSVIHMPPGPSMGHALYHRMNARLEMQRCPDDPFTNDHLEYLLPGLHGCRDLLNYRDLLFRLAGVTDDGGGKMSGTSHLNVMDSAGNAIALTFSIGEGSGIFIEGTDIHMNNMLGEPALLPDGLESWVPDKRLASMMSPTIITDPSGLLMLLGTGGAERIPVMLASVIHYLMDFDLDLAEAIEAPRAYLSSDQLEVEPGFEKGEILDLLPARYWEKKSLYFGGVHAISNKGGHVSAAADSRREGHAMVE